MKALTEQLPYGGLIADGTKTVETRSWSTNYRGLLAVHNGKSWPKHLRPFVRQWTDWNDDDLRFQIAQVFGRVDYDHCPGDLIEDASGDYWRLEPSTRREWTPGAVVAVAELVDVVPMTRGLDEHDGDQIVIDGDELTYAWLGQRFQPDGTGSIRDDGTLVTHGDWVDKTPEDGYGLTDISSERSVGLYEPGRYGWVLANVRRLITPVPATGRLGLWNLPGDIAAAVENAETIAVTS